MIKQYKYPKREKKSKILLYISFILVIMAICLCDTPANKIASNIEYIYNINQYQIYCKNKSDILGILNDPNICEVNIVYSYSVPLGNNLKDGDVINLEYNINYHTIPFSNEAFKLSKNILFGTYFTSEDQIILSYDEAIKIGEPSSLIGNSMDLYLFDGTYSFIIVGIFKPFNKFEEQYLSVSGINLETSGSGIFLNGKFVDKYENNINLNNNGKRLYCIYFKNFNSMKNNYINYNNKMIDTILLYANIDISIYFTFEYMFYVITPIVLVIIFISLLLYNQIKKLELSYNKHLLYMYLYSGYSTMNIKLSYIICNIIEVIFIALLALTTSIFCMEIINYINKIKIIISFQIFTYNIVLLVIFFIIISTLSFIFSLFSLNLNKKTKWYQVLLYYRDLL